MLNRRNFVVAMMANLVAVKAAFSAGKPEGPPQEGAGGPPDGAGAPPGGADGPKGGPPPMPKSFDHKQPFSVITMGTNCPALSEKRASTCTVVQFNGKYYVLDTGNGAALNFGKGGYALSDIEAIMFTHLHLDHTSDYMEVLVNRWMTGAKELDLIGPPRTAEMHKVMTEFYADDLLYRMLRGRARGVDESGMFKDVNAKDLTGANTFELDGMKVTTAELTHTMYNLGYRFDVNGQSIVVSGDTSFDEDLITLAKDADILVMDSGSLMPKMAMKDAETSETDVFEDGSKKPKPRYKFSGNFDVQPHVDLTDIITIVTKANVKKLVLSHFPPFAIDEKQVVKWIREGGYKGEVIFGYDTLEINP
jgi:ribonuclease BN (tRNA processing enzyme)